MNKVKKYIIYTGIILFLGIFLYSIVLHFFYSGSCLTICLFIMLIALYLVWCIIFDRLEDYRNSRILKYLKKNIVIIVIILIISLIVTCISYPGMWYSDSYLRVDLAINMNGIINNAIHGLGGKYSSAYTPIPSFIMYMCYSLFNDLASYTMAQAFFLMLGIVLLIDSITSKKSHKYIGITLFLTCPIVLCTSTYFECGVGCLTGIIFLVIALTHLDYINSLDKYIQYITIIFSCFIIFGYRINAFTILPVIFVAIYIFYKANKKQLVSITVVTLIGLVLVQGFLSWTRFKVTMSSSEAFAWEIITTIDTMPNDQKKIYATYLDDIYGEGSTEKALEVTNADNIWSTLEVLNATRDQDKGNSIQNEVIKRYFSFIRDNPSQFLKTKWYFVSSMLGIEQPLRLNEWDYNRFDKMGAYNFNDSSIRLIYYYSYIIAFNDIISRPWIMFLITLVLIYVHKTIIKRTDKYQLTIEWFLFIIAMFYYGAFLVNTQSLDFRYFYPSCILLLLSSFSAIVNSAPLLINKYKSNTKNNV